MEKIVVRSLADLETLLTTHRIIKVHAAPPPFYIDLESPDEQHQYRVTISGQPTVSVTNSIVTVEAGVNFNVEHLS